MRKIEETARASTSKSFQKLNPHLFGHGGEDDAEHDLIEALTTPKPKRLKQNSKPVLNKLEAEYLRVLTVLGKRVLSQSVTLKLANGVRYTPDFFCFDCNTAWEVKGRHAWEDAMIKLKFAAKEYPKVKFLLVWKQDGRWQEQEILP